MIGLDTNVIVRYLVQDEPKQSERANAIIEKAIADGETLGISIVTLCEIVWVLQSCYGSDKKELINVLRKLLQIQHIRIDHETVVRLALRDFEHCSGVDFSDCLIGRQNVANECSFTYTFDRNAAKKLPLTFKLATHK